MTQSKMSRAIGLVKDKTSIGLAKVSMGVSSTDLEVAIVKVTRHNASPPEEKHVREVIALTSYSRFHVSLAVSAISRRLAKTRNWIVALKCLVLIHRLLADGDRAYEQELTYATRKGTRILNLSDFRDTSHSDSWHFSAFVRTYALYLDQRLESRKKCGDDHPPPPPTQKPLPEQMGTHKVFARIQGLQHILERFLATRPTGFAKYNPLVIMSLFPVVQESFAMYNEIREMMSILIDRFTSLDVPDCVITYETFGRLGKQLDELDTYFDWSKSVGIARSFEYPVIERVTQRKLQIMDEYIRGKSTSFKRRSSEKMSEPDHDDKNNSAPETKAPPAPSDEQTTCTAAAEGKSGDGRINGDQEAKEVEDQGIQDQKEKVPDLLDLSGDFNEIAEENNLALALFSGETSAPVPSTSIDFSSPDWELALVESATDLGAKKIEMGGGFNRLVLDGLYESYLAHASMNQAAVAGSASSMVMAQPQQMMLALPAPPTGESRASAVPSDPFVASMTVAPPAYVQMSDMDKKQAVMTHEQLMWAQYATNGMQGQLGLPQQWNAYAAAPGRPITPAYYPPVQPNPYGGYVQR